VSHGSVEDTVVHLKNRAFSMVELLIALSVIAVIAGFTIPKLLGSAGDAELKTRLRQVFTLVGEGFSSRKKDDAFAPISSNVAGEPLTFYTFLHQNSNFLDAIAPGTLTAATVCTTATPLMTLHNGAVIRQICPYDPTGLRAIGLTVLIQVPVNANVTTQFTELLLFDSENYTTLRGHELNNGMAASACTLSDAVLNVDSTCEGTAP